MIEDKQINKVQVPIKPTLSIKKRKKIKANFPVQLLLVVVLVIAGIISWNTTRGANRVIMQRSAAAEEAARPANLEIITVSDKNCAQCSSLDNYLSYIKKQNVNIVKENNLDLLDSQAQELVQKYKLKKAPFFVVTGEINKLGDLQTLWSAWGMVENNTFILTNTFPPFLNLDTGEVEGLVSVTYLEDKSCSECYDVKINAKILETNYGVKIVNEKTVDISDPEGKELLTKYNITKVPTFLIDNKAAVYEGLLYVWKVVGSIESDGTYIFRGVGVLGAYYDLEKGEVVQPASKTNTNQGS